MTFSLLHATDFADRLLYNIIPPLKAGMIVLADRYAYTAFARDATRGVDNRWVRELYSFAVRPDLAVYFRVPIEVSVDRLMARRVKLKFYEAGMDMGWSPSPIESFRMFQGRVLEEYDRLVEEFGLDVIDASEQHHRTAARVPQARHAASRRRARGTGRSRAVGDDGGRDDATRLLTKTARMRRSDPAITTGTASRTCRSTAIPGRSSRSKGPTGSGARLRFACCGNGSKSRATGSSRPAGPVRR